MFAPYGVTHSEQGVLRQSKGKVGVRPRDMIRAVIFLSLFNLHSMFYDFRSKQFAGEADKSHFYSLFTCS